MCCLSDSGFPLVIFLKHKKTSLDITNKMQTLNQKFLRCLMLSQYFLVIITIWLVNEIVQLLKWCKNAKILWYETEK